MNVAQESNFLWTVLGSNLDTDQLLCLLLFISCKVLFRRVESLLWEFFLIMLLEYYRKSSFKLCSLFQPRRALISWVNSDSTDCKNCEISNLDAIKHVMINIRLRMFSCLVIEKLSNRSCQ